MNLGKIEWYDSLSQTISALILDNTLWLCTHEVQCTRFAFNCCKASFLCLCAVYVHKPKYNALYQFYSACARKLQHSSILIKSYLIWTKSGYPFSFNEKSSQNFTILFTILVDIF